MATRKSIERGETISAPLKETKVFPPMVTQMIGVGEATGALDTMLGEDRRLLRGGSGHRGRRPADAARADHDRRARRRRRRHRHRDVSADLRSDQQADVVHERDGALRRSVAWLIAIRAVISTMLLGSATFMRVDRAGIVRRRPVLLPDRLTYALTIAYALTLRFVERYRWLVDLQLGLRRAARVGLHLLHRRRHAAASRSLYVLPVIAASTMQFRRGGLLVATLEHGALRRPGAGAVSGGIGAARPIRGSTRHTRSRCRRGSVARYTVALNVFGSVRRRAARRHRSPRSLRSAGAQLVQASTEIADLQALEPARHRQPARAGWRPPIAALRS